MHSAIGLIGGGARGGFSSICWLAGMQPASASACGEIIIIGARPSAASGWPARRQLRLGGGASASNNRRAAAASSAAGG